LWFATEDYYNAITTESQVIIILEMIVVDIEIQKVISISLKCDILEL